MNYRKEDIKQIVDGLNKLTLAVQKLMKENVHKQQPSFKVLDTKACTKEFLIERVLLGVWLLIAKKAMQHGEFQAFRKARGLSARTGVYTMNVAKRFLSESAIPIPRMCDFGSWNNQIHVRDAVALYVGDKSWCQIRGK